MKIVRGTVCFVCAVIAMAVIAGCTYHEHYYGVGSLAEKDVIIKESNQEE